MKCKYVKEIHLMDNITKQRVIWNKCTITSERYYRLKTKDSMCKNKRYEQV
jgi:hypothetical protein